MDWAFRDVCGNGLTGNASLPISSFNPRSDGLTHTDTVTGFESSYNRLSILSPKKPEYATYEARLASFNSPEWPAASCPVDVHLLAAAGFFYHGNYEGYQDSVRCYHCGIGLCKWQPGDDAWSEHSRSSSVCMFVHDLNNKNRYKALKDQLLSRGDEQSVSPVVQEQPSYEQLSPPNSQSSQCTLTSNNHHSDILITDSNASSSTSENLTVAPNTSTMKPSPCPRLTCKVCLMQELSVLFLPCRHLVSCVQCASKVRTCPTCRREILAAIETYIS